MSSWAQKGDFATTMFTNCSHSLSLVCMQYKTWRSWPEVDLHLICREGGFDNLPQRIRQLGPWTGSWEWRAPGFEAALSSTAQ
jgi:hypothetical protein